MTTAERLVLRVIARNDGQWGWYQVARLLGDRGYPNENPVEILRSLCNQGLLVADGDSAKSSTRYSVTPRGRQVST